MTDPAELRSTTPPKRWRLEMADKTTRVVEANFSICHASLGCAQNLCSAHSCRTDAHDPHHRGPNQHTARTERKVLKRGVTVNCIQLARLQNCSITNQEKASCNKPLRRSSRQSHHGRGPEIRDEMFCMPAECRSCHGARRQPCKSCERNHAANEGCFPKHGCRNLYRQSIQCRVHLVCRGVRCAGLSISASKRSPNVMAWVSLESRRRG
jgi:hypothetical protein